MANTELRYIATAKGYYAGRVIEEGEAFVADFRELVREPHKFAKDKGGNETDKVKVVGDIVREKGDEPKRGKLKVPTWARPADEKEFLAAQAADETVTDPNFEEMSIDALQAYAATKNVPFTAKTKREDLITAIKAANDFTR